MSDCQCPCIHGIEQDRYCLVSTATVEVSGLLEELLIGIIVVTCYVYKRQETQLRKALERLQLMSENVCPWSTDSKQQNPCLFC